jgi:diaminopimelate decarboxylase
VMGAGAYGYVMASNYNSRPRPAELMVFEGEVKVARRAETQKDLIRGEKIIL